MRYKFNLNYKYSKIKNQIPQPGMELLPIR